MCAKDDCELGLDQNPLVFAFYDDKVNTEKCYS